MIGWHFHLLYQAQDSPDNSMFSFQLGTISAEDEAISSAESDPLSEETKTKLQEILQFLNQDIGQLVQDTELIRTILKSPKGILPESLKVFFPNLLRKHCTLLLISRATSFQSSKLRNAYLIGSTKSKRSNREMTWKILWKQLAERLPP